MAFKTAQVAVSASTITDLMATAGFTKNGGASDPCPIQFMVTSGTVYWGGSNVSASNGFLMQANTPVIINAYSNDYPYVFSTGTPTVYLVAGRQ